MRTQRDGGRKTVKFCGRPLWMAPNLNKIDRVQCIFISSPITRTCTIQRYNTLDTANLIGFWKTFATQKGISDFQDSGRRFENEGRQGSKERFYNGGARIQERG